MGSLPPHLIQSDNVTEVNFRISLQNSRHYHQNLRGGEYIHTSKKLKVFTGKGRYMYMAGLGSQHIHTCTIHSK